MFAAEFDQLAINRPSPRAPNRAQRPRNGALAAAEDQDVARVGVGQHRRLDQDRDERFVVARALELPSRRAPAVIEYLAMTTC